MPRINGKKKQFSYDSGFRLTDGLYSSFLLYNPITKKNERFSINPSVHSKKEAQSERKKIELQLGIAQARAKKRFEFLQKFNDQSKLFDSYQTWRQKVAKNSWKEEVSRMTCYVFPYFIGQLNLNHPSLWFEHWQSFQDHLGTPIRKNTKGKELSVNTKDNIIRAANSFITFVEMSEGGSPIKRLPEFKYEEKGRRGAESVYSQSEIDKVVTEFQKSGHEKYAALFYILSMTGLRVSEGIGLLAQDIVVGQVPPQEKWIFTALKDKTELYGFILLKSQPFDSNHLVINGVAKRAPLKKRKRIAPEYNRLIPLIDEKLTRLLSGLKKQAGSTGLIFEDCTYREFYKIFTNVRTTVKLSKEKDIHSLRHTFATRLAKLCDGDPRIVEKVLGHSDPKMTVRYNHLANELDTLEIKDSDDIKPLKLG